MGLRYHRPCSGAPSLAAHVHVDPAAEGARIPCALPIPLPFAKGFVEKEKGKKKNLLKACAYECFITRFSFDCEAAF